MNQKHRNESVPGSRGAASPDLDMSAGRWRDILMAIKNASSQDRLSLIAAGVSFFGFLSIFPALTALLSVYGLVSDPSEVAHQLGSLQGTLPSSALQLIQRQMSSIAQSTGSSLGVALVASVLVAIYSASKGMGAMVSALNIAFDKSESRGVIKHKALTLLYTLAAIGFAVIMLGLIGLTAYLQHRVPSAWLDVVIKIVSWAILLTLMTVAVTALYALTPSRSRPSLRQVAPGAILATLMWLIASLSFNFFLTHFKSYNPTYGSITGIVVLMLWFWISAFVILLGAEVNAVLQHPPGTGKK